MWKGIMKGTQKPEFIRNCVGFDSERGIVNIDVQYVNKSYFLQNADLMRSASKE